MGVRVKSVILSTVSNDSDLDICQISLIISNNIMEQHFFPCKWPAITDQNLENPNKPDFFGTKVDKIDCFV